MKNIVMFFTMTLLLTSAFAGAMESVEGPKTCKQCGMDRTAFAQSRMLIVYADNTAVGVCSLHCTAAELQQNRDKRVSSLMVADYFTKELVDAKTATWVVGGNKMGVMTAVAKWAFAKAGVARNFVEGNGGMVSSFDQAMNLAAMEIMDQDTEASAVKNEMLRELQ